jgi:hypothetical protein
MSLADRAKAAREIADATGDPADEMYARALEDVETAEARDQLRELLPESDLTDIPPPPIETMRIPRGGVEN